MGAAYPKLEAFKQGFAEEMTKIFQAKLNELHSKPVYDWSKYHAQF